MIFAGFTFLFRFLPIVLIAYILCPKQFRNGLLFLASLIFYAWGEPVYVLLMLFSTVSDYWHGRRIDAARRTGRQKAAKGWLISSIVINLAMLGFFKYADWLIGIWNGVMGSHVPLFKLPLPLGISFYTFQTMSYSIDVYRGDAKVQTNIIDFGMFVSLFPQLIAGPIVRYADIEDRMKERPLCIGRMSEGALRFAVGLAKKVLLANQFGVLWETIAALPPTEMPVLTGWLGIIAYGLQIYYDFSGYSDMAIGLGAIFGFHFPENFDHPYESRSVSEFFRRWHMTLQKWFASYVYYPLGGNRKGMKRQILNLLVVWALTGIWHGASGNFMAWGLYFACFLILEKVCLQKVLACMPRVFGHLYTLIVVLFGWVLFTHTNLFEAVQYMARMLAIPLRAAGSAAGVPGGGLGGLYNARTWYYLFQYGGLLLLGAVGATNLPVFLAKKLKFYGKNWNSAIFIAILLLLCIASLVDASYNPFLYFRF
ncbi:MAG: MBOAT family protein [Lachnospiraceae bacterium]|nr:MBOAT family protein [Lachnospiraceae bacterium]